MFVNQHHLEYLLRPECYFSEEHLQQEIRELFLPAWQLLICKSELPNSGDFMTLELFGHLLLIRNCDGEYRAFQNVCAHRHCQISSLPKGHSPVLRCQYHGWEYDSSGKTGKIPDARCFRPWDRENSHLVTYRLESCGDLLFIALKETLPPLRDWLAPNFDELAANFSAPEWAMHWVWEYDCECNWKVPIENTVESYHVQALHQKFYGDFYPSEEKTIHTLSPCYTSLTYLSDTKMEAWQGWLRNWLGGKATLRYVHHHYFPNTIFVTTDTLNYALMAVPTSPRTVRIRMRTFGIQGTRRDPFSRVAAWYAWRLGKKNTLQVHNEDLAIYPDQQRGLEASRQRGVIGTREERIYAFHEYIMNELGMPRSAQ